MTTVPVLSLKKALDMLEILAFEDASSQGIALSDLARRMGMAPNTARNLLKTMIICGFVAQNDAGRYIPGDKCRKLAQSTRRKALGEIATPLLRALSASLDEVTLLAMLINSQRAVIAQVEPQQSIRVDTTSLPDINPYGLATGRVLMAFADEQDLRQILSRYAHPGAEWPEIHSMQDFAPQFEQIRRDGHCVMTKDQQNLIAFAVPVVGADNTLVGAIGCYAPIFRCPIEKQKLILREMRVTAGLLAGRAERLG